MPKSYAQLFRDGDAGLDYAQARMYQSRTGRLNAPDPVFAKVSDPQKLNRYSYARNNPVSFVDPSGLDECTWDSETNTLNCPPGGGGGGGGSPGNPGDPGDTCAPPRNIVASMMMSDCEGGGGEEPGGGGSGGEEPPPGTPPTTPPGPTPPAPPPVPPVPPTPPPGPEEDDLVKKMTCTADAAFNFAMTTGVPGYAAAKAVAGVFNVNFNPIQGLLGHKDFFTSEPNPFSMASGAPAVVWGFAELEFEFAGGQRQLDRWEDLTSRQSTGEHYTAKYGARLSNLQRLGKIAKFAGQATGILGGASAIYDAVGCWTN